MYQIQSDLLYFLFRQMTRIQEYGLPIPEIFAQAFPAASGAGLGGANSERAEQGGAGRSCGFAERWSLEVYLGDEVSAYS